MNVERKHEKFEGTTLKEALNLSIEYSHDLQFYDKRPSGEVLLDELRNCCHERLSVLKEVSKIVVKNEKKTATDCRKKLVERLKNNKLHTFAHLCEGTGSKIPTQERLQARRRDLISNCMLRVAYSSEVETCEWLCSMEENLFAWRLTALDSLGVLRFMRLNSIQYPILPNDEKNLYKTVLTTVMEEPCDFETTDFYKIPAMDVLNLVAERKVFLEKGIAYVTETQLADVMYAEFQRRFEMELQASRGAVSYMEGDERIYSLVNHLQLLNKRMQRASKNPQKTLIEDLDFLAKTSYPPCMRRLHEAVQKNHHLRNGGRVQYTLFLKKIGVEAQDAVVFFKKEFTKKMDEKTFVKEFQYQFRHMYGLVGSKKNYGLPNCAKIVDNCIEGPLEFHGCMVAMTDIEDLGNKLSDWGISSEHREEIISFSKKEKYSDACCEYFKALHRGLSPSCEIINPGDFYTESKRIREEIGAEEFIEENMENNLSDVLTTNQEETAEKSDELTDQMIFQAHDDSFDNEIMDIQIDGLLM